MIKSLFLLLIFIVALNAGGREILGPGGERLFFHEVNPSAAYSETSGCERFDYEFRLTNLKNANRTGRVADLPAWDGEKMGGVFEEASKVDPNGFYEQWGHNGASSDGVSAQELGICHNCIENGDPWAFLYQEVISEDSFAFYKFVEGRNVEVNQPHMVNFKGLAAETSVAYSNAPAFENVKGQLRLFIPFAMDADNQVMPNKLKINGQIVSVPSYVKSSRNFSGNVASDFDPTDTEAQPGLCILFYPVSAEIPHDVTPESSHINLGGATMSSFRNEEIASYNKNSSPLRYCPMADWGYEGYFYSDRERCMANMIPKVDRGCRCRGNYDELVCHNDKEVLVMDCSQGSEGAIPIGRKEGIEPFQCENSIIKIDGVEVNCCDPGVTGYSGQDIGYACSYVVRHPEVKKISITNWTKNTTFSLTKEAR